MSLFDKELALNQAGGNAELALELFEMLVKDLPAYQRAMNQAFTENNRENSWEATHKIHGGTAYCGVPDLKASCKTLEDMIKNLQSDDDMHSETMRIAVENLNHEITRLIDAADSINSQLAQGEK